MDRNEINLSPLTENRPQTLNDVLMSMFDYSISEMLELIPTETSIDKLKKIAARDLLKYVRGKMEKQIYEIDEEIIKKSFVQYGRMMTEFTRRIESWNGEGIKELVGGMDGFALTEKTDTETETEI